jgi:2,4-dienoyl-CoA reductase (NADPH2)
MSGSRRFERLLQPHSIGQVRTRNRIIKTASGAFYIEPDGGVGKRACAYYEAFARGGVGLLIVESCGVDYPHGVQHTIQLHLDDDKYIPGYRRLTDAVHRHGCPVFLQFQHAGPWNPTGMEITRDTPSASSIDKAELPGPDFAAPRGLSLAEVKDQIDIWAKAAVRAEKAGFDGVEINGGTCHQINTFFSRIWNRRDDEYGCGSLENRARFMCDIVREVKKRVRPDFAVTVLLNAAEYGHEKATTLEEGVALARYLETAGADAIQVRAHLYQNRWNRGGLLQPDRLFYPEPPRELPDGLDWSHKGAGAIVPLAEAVKKAVSVPVFCACRLDPSMGEEILRERKMDFIGMTRRLLADPEMPNKLAAGKLDDIRPCAGCLYCRSFVLKNEPAECRVNAAMGREHEYETTTPVSGAKKKKRVMVVGGGPAGLEAARVAASRGHDVTLLEQGPRLGGLLPLAALVNDVELTELLGLVRYYTRQLDQLGVTIILGKKADMSTVKELRPDAIILATGGKPAALTIPGIDRSNVRKSSDLHRLLKFYGRFLNIRMLARLSKVWMPVGKRVTVIGGSIQGCELAEFLTKRGRLVTIVDTKETLAEGMTLDNQRKILQWFDEKRVPRLTGITYREITERGLVITYREGETKTIESDTVIVIEPLQSDTHMLEYLKGSAPEMHVIGDCREPHLIAQAITDGWRVAHEI